MEEVQRERPIDSQDSDTRRRIDRARAARSEPVARKRRRARSLFKMALGSSAIRFRIKTPLDLSAVPYRGTVSQRSTSPRAVTERVVSTTRFGQNPSRIEVRPSVLELSALGVSTLS